MAGRRRRWSAAPPGALDRAGRAGRRAEARLWTGPVAHLVGGALDVLGALGRYGLARARARVRRR